MNYKNEVLKLSERMRLVSINKDCIYLQANYGPSKIVKIPLKIEENLACLIGIIIGDGHLAKKKFKTSIEISNKQVLSILLEIVYTLFEIKTRVIPIIARPNKKKTYHLTIYSKAVQELLNLVFKIPRGKKCYNVKIPELILKEKPSIKYAFMIGLLIAEGSRKGKYYIRISNASKYLINNIQELLIGLGIKSTIESWINKKYKRVYYSISFERIHLDSFMRECRSGQTGQILSIFKKIVEDQA